MSQSWFSIELSAYHEVPEWGGQVNIPHFFDPCRIRAVGKAG